MLDPKLDVIDMVSKILLCAETLLLIKSQRIINEFTGVKFGVNDPMRLY